MFGIVHIYYTLAYQRGFKTGGGLIAFGPGACVSHSTEQTKLKFYPRESRT